jgi:hypothetical protein
MDGINALGSSPLAPAGAPLQTFNPMGPQAIQGSAFASQEDTLTISSEAFLALEEASATGVDLGHPRHRLAVLELLTYSNFQVTESRSAEALAQLGGVPQPGTTGPAAPVPGAGSAGSSGTASA